VPLHGNELARVLEKQLAGDGKPQLAIGIETLRFEADGSVLIRTGYRVSERDRSELGEMFRKRLPK